MRKIKFRAIKDDMSNPNFVYGDLIYDKDKRPRIKEREDMDLFTTCIKGTEGQFTGKKDANGKEIYEGDIVRDIDCTLLKVEYDDGCFVLTSKIEDYFLSDFIKIGTAFVDVEVIGNIHENPEL